MIKKLILMLALSIFLGVFTLSFSGPYSGYSESTNYLELKEHAAGQKPDALKRIGEVLGAELVPFKLEHSLAGEMELSDTGNPVRSLAEKVKVNEIGFPVEGISKEDIKNIELVIDENDSGNRSAFFYYQGIRIDLLLGSNFLELNYQSKNFDLPLTL